MQFTCFFTRDDLKNLEGIYALRQKYQDAFASADLETPPVLFIPNVHFSSLQRPGGVRVLG